MKTFRLWDKVCGWLVFFIALTTYILTLEPTASFWDCGEFISSAYKLDVGHPPGAPFFMLMGHFFSLFAQNPSDVAFCVNALSAFASAFCILFLFWTITALGLKLIVNTVGVEDRDGLIIPKWKVISLLGAGIVGSLAYTFSDTFWFSAVEGEVYGSSSFFTSIVFWLILKWDECADQPHSDRWLILIMYLMGISIGVHLLNLLTVPAIVLVYYFREYKFSWKGFIWALIISVGVLGFILYGIIPGVPTVAGWFDLFFVNVLGFSFNSGVIVFLILLTLLLICAIIYTYHRLLKSETTLNRWLNTGVVMFAVILFGYSSYTVLVIRSLANPPMDQNSPDDVFALKSYLQRDQYGDRPLFYGKVFNAPVQLKVEGNICVPIINYGANKYTPAPKNNGEKDRYVVASRKISYKYIDDFCMLLPRMYSDEGRHVQAYKEWGDIKGRRVRYDYCGQRKTGLRPTFAENLRFFFSYQVNFMYWRYFMWNFAGRQNDLQSYGDISKGNWLSGIPFIDNWRLGDQSKLPTELRENKGHNVYYMLPLLLGIIGILWQFSKKHTFEEKIGRKFQKQDFYFEGRRSFVIVFLLFFLTGLAIILYLNQTPYQPRERDYAYAGSFYAFCIWIGFGVLALADGVKEVFTYRKNIDKEENRAGSENKLLVMALCVTLLCMLVPIEMAFQNWDDHDRSKRYSCRDFGANYLLSCDNDAILFTNGDNDTFPLWYNQEVEGVRTDMRVCNLSYLQTDWYISQMKRPYYTSSPLPISWEYKDYMEGVNEYAHLEKKSNNPMEVAELMDFLKSDKSKTKQTGQVIFPTDQIYIEDTMGNIINIKKINRLLRSEMMILEMLSNIAKSGWQRPIYFAMTVGDEYYLGLRPYFEQTGLTYKITPFRNPNGRERINVDVMYDNVMHKYRYGNMNIPGVYIDENLRRMCDTHRMLFSQLAEELSLRGDTTRCREVMNYAEEVLPHYNFPYDYISALMANLYLGLGQESDIEKAKEILDGVATTSVEYLQWGNSLNKVQKKSIGNILQQQQSILGYVLQICSRYNLKELLDRYYSIYQQFDIK